MKQNRSGLATFQHEVRHHEKKEDCRNPGEKGPKGLKAIAGRKTLLALAAFIVVVSVSVFFNAFSCGFVHDDNQQVVINPWIRSASNIPQIFSSGVWDFQNSVLPTNVQPMNYYRPLMYVIYMLVYYISGLDPAGFHVANVFFHAGVSLLVFIIMLTLVEKAGVGAPKASLTACLVASLLFATHPVHTEAVTWIAGLPDLSYSFFYLLSFYLYVKSKDGFNSYYFLSVLSFSFSTLCKEPALTLPLMLAAYDFAFTDEGTGLTRYLKRYMAYLAVAGVYFAVRSYALKGIVPAANSYNLTIAQYVLNVFFLFGMYMKKLFLPLNLHFFYGFDPVRSVLSLRGAAAVAVAAVFAGGLVFAARRQRMVFFGLVALVGPLLPALYFPAIAGKNPFAERYLYLPSFGFVFLIALLLIRMGKRVSQSALVLVPVVALYSVGTLQRNTVWMNDYTFVTDEVKKAPDSAEPHVTLGNILLAGGRYDAAIEQYRIATGLDADLPYAFMQTGVAYAAKGLTNRAIECYQKAIELAPGLVDAHYNLGLSYAEAGDYGRAIEEMSEAVRMQPENALTQDNLGVLYAKSNMIEQAIPHFEIAVRLAPNNPFYSNHLEAAYALRRSGR